MDWEQVLRVVVAFLPVAEALLLCLVCRAFRNFERAKHVERLDSAFFKWLANAPPAKQQEVLRLFMVDGGYLKVLDFPPRQTEQFEPWPIGTWAAAVELAKSLSSRLTALSLFDFPGPRLTLPTAVTPHQLAPFSQIVRLALGVLHLDSVRQAGGVFRQATQVHVLTTLPDDVALDSGELALGTADFPAVRGALPVMFPSVERLMSDWEEIYVDVTQQSTQGANAFSHMTHLAVVLSESKEAVLQHDSLPPGLQVLAVEWRGLNDPLVRRLTTLLDARPALAVCVKSYFVKTSSPLATLALQQRESVSVLPSNVLLDTDWVTAAPCLRLLFGGAAEWAREWPGEKWCKHWCHNSDEVVPDLYVDTHVTHPAHSNSAAPDVPIDLVNCDMVQLRVEQLPIAPLPSFVRLCPETCRFSVKMQSDSARWTFTFNLHLQTHADSAGAATQQPLSLPDFLTPVAQGREMTDVVFESGEYPGLRALDLLLQFDAAHPGVAAAVVALNLVVTPETTALWVEHGKSLTGLRFLHVYWHTATHSDPERSAQCLAQVLRELPPLYGIWVEQDMACLWRALELLGDAAHWTVHDNSARRSDH